ncbi:hypothetical protein [Thalassotalea agarivorans]|uniref:Uncharacterized protein n=1 Tax=Thalassotalea agarivorans TaxID=349064 RepID=A0A1I0EWU6_THASX|nr:hypothetical protein [Thalassotalea agarivorans]SET49949.1 hypothetical protein SAMN05660429_01972 [Thalassotalea agarivorans]
MRFLLLLFLLNFDGNETINNDFPLNILVPAKYKLVQGGSIEDNVVYFALVSRHTDGPLKGRVENVIGIRQFLEVTLFEDKLKSMKKREKLESIVRNTHTCFIDVTIIDKGVDVELPTYDRMHVTVFVIVENNFYEISGSPKVIVESLGLQCLSELKQKYKQLE